MQAATFSASFNVNDALGSGAFGQVLTCTAAAHVLFCFSNTCCGGGGGGGDGDGGGGGGGGVAVAVAVAAAAAVAVVVVVVIFPRLAFRGIPFRDIPSCGLSPRGVSRL